MTGGWKSSSVEVTKWKSICKVTSNYRLRKAAGFFFGGTLMKNTSHKDRGEMTFFINPNTRKIEYNKLCAKCSNECKQSFRAEVVQCQLYRKPKKPK